MFIYGNNQLKPMSGTKNPFDPLDLFNQWMQQNKHLQEEFQKGFERMTQQSNDINKMTQVWQRIGDQMEMMSKAGNENVHQFGEMMRNTLSPWRSPPEFTSVPGMLTGWATFKTGIGSNGRISIPEAERSALGLSEGDLVQVIVLPVSKKKEVK